MDRIDIEKLRWLSCEGAAQRLGIKVKQHKALCPFHDDHTPSLTFKKNKWKCWSCGEGGDTISLVQKVLGKDFCDACRWLADEHNVIVSSFRIQDSSAQESKPFDASRYERFFERPWLSPEARRFLFDERRIDPRVVRWCRLTSWTDRQGIHWLQIPYYDREGKLTGIQNRNLVSSSKVQVSGGNDLKPETWNLKPAAPRFRFPKGSRCGIYNLPVLNLLRQGEPLYIAEGCSDCWSLLSAGHKAIAIPSATLLSRSDKEQLLALRSTLSTVFHMYPDQDAPGERLFLQLREVLPSLERHQLPAGCKDYSDYYVKGKGYRL